MVMKIEEISQFIDESKKYIAKGNAVQASEKLYKAVEECIKILAKRYNLTENDEAEKDGRWKGYLLGKAARRLTQNLGKNKINETWAIAFNIHVWGFHEGRYGVDDVEQGISYAEWFVDFVSGKEDGSKSKS